jgi:DNA-binding LacI/PurR family transcriptional regulator
MKEIARLAGVNVSTVSRALQGLPRIPKETRQRIQEIADRLGYQPDPMLSALASYRRTKRPISYQGTFAWLDTSETEYRFQRNLKRSTLLPAASEQAKKYGYQVEPFWYDPSKSSGKELSRILIARNIQGVLLPPRTKTPISIEMKWPHFSTVEIGYSVVHPTFHSIALCPFRAMVTIMQRLQKLGFQRIGLVLSVRETTQANHSWRAGFLIEQQNVPPPLRIPPLILKEHTESQFLPWFRKHSPDVVISHLYQFIPDWIRKNNKQIPQDVSFVCQTTRAGFEMDGISRMTQLIAHTAVDFLVGMIHRNERGVPENPQRLLIEGNWMDGKTLGKPPKT